MPRMTATANRMLESYRLSREMRRRQPPRLSTRPRASSANPTVYYLAPDLDLPIGGIRVIYRHVDTLNALGVPAAVIHGTDTFRSTWFAHGTRIVSADGAPLHPDDILVVPEWYGPALDQFPRDVRLVVFNQRAYDTWDFVPYDETPAGAPYAGFGQLAALLAVSADNAALLRYAFPGVPVEVTRNVIDPAVFHPGGRPAPRRISFTTTRRAREREQLLHILRSRDALRGWELTPIEGRTEAETAEIMRSSAIFLSFSDREGFGLPPAEAMASGCFVVGYDGLAGREFFDPAYCAPVADGDLLAFARAVEAACAAYDADRESFAKLGAAAAEQVSARYSLDGLRADLLAFYQRLLGT